MSLEPIGVIRSPFVEPADAPRQPAAGRGVRGRIELFEGKNLGDAIADLEGWSHLWVLFWFHRAPGYRPKVLPPRSSRRRGVLATRSPHRPNPIGLSLVRLEAVAGLVLEVADLDILDGSPVLDIKPYVPYADLANDARSGWLEADPLPRWTVTWSPRAEEQLAYLASWGVELREPVEQRLALGPQPHAYRRIKLTSQGYRLAYKEWRLAFAVEDRRIVVEAIASGYRPRELATGTEPHLVVHQRFFERYQRSPA